MNRRTSPLLDQLTAASHDTDAPALRGPAGAAVVTYGELSERSEELARALVDAGVGVGDRVAYQLAKTPAAIGLHLALLKCGAVQVPLNPAYPEAEVRALLNDAEPVIVVRSPDAPPLRGPWRSMTLDDPEEGWPRDLDRAPTASLPRLSASDGAALLYTSGTTGRPKGALLSHGNLAANARTLVKAWEFTPSDVLLHVLPLFHTHGLFVAVHCVVTSGASMVLVPAFDIETVLRELPDCTVMMGVPTHYTRLLDDPRFGATQAANVRLFISGSAPMTGSTHADFKARCGVEILERYGMTETTMLASNPLNGERRPGTVGPALPGVSIRVVGDLDERLPAGEAGHVLVRGPDVFSGYWRRPDLTDEIFTSDGWFRTGDLGRLASDGYLELVGRSKDLVITGGYNVYPKDVEVVLDSLPGVDESAVVGVPDNDLGEQVVGVVVAEAGADVDPDRLRSQAKSLLVGYKVPKRIVVVEALPRNAMGKVQKTLLLEQLSEGAT